MDRTAKIAMWGAAMAGAFGPLIFPVVLYFGLRALSQSPATIFLTQGVGLLIGIAWPIVYLIWLGVSRTKFSGILFVFALASSAICIWILYFDPCGRIRSTLAG